VWRTHRGDHTGVTRAGLVYRAAGRAVPGEFGVTSWGPVRFRRGVTLPVRWAPVGGSVGRVGWAARTAPARVLRHRGDRVELRLASRRSVWIAGGVTCVAGHAGRSPRRPTGSAGASFRAGRRPRVRGVAMNPVDHPHGGGQGKTSGGRPGVTPWGRLTRGRPTRRRG
jgi:large subunit ribosomal protein L2